MTVPLLIGFSGKIASGKSTIARTIGEYLFNDNYVVLSFADSLREECDYMLSLAYTSPNPSDIKNDVFFKDISKDKVEHIVDLLVKAMNDNTKNSRERTPIMREILQYWGTSVRREHNENYWVEKLMLKAEFFLHQGTHVIVDDVRFVNEAEAIVEKGTIVRINIDKELQLERLNDRDGDKVHITSNHPSENSLDNYPKFDILYTAHRDDSIGDATRIIVDNLKAII